MFTYLFLCIWGRARASLESGRKTEVEQSQWKSYNFILSSKWCQPRFYLLDLYSLARNLTFNSFNLSQDRVMMLPNPSKPCELLTTILLVLLLLLFLAKNGRFGSPGMKVKMSSVRGTERYCCLFPSAGSIVTS